MYGYDNYIVICTGYSTSQILSWGKCICSTDDFMGYSTSQTLSWGKVHL